MKKFKNTFGVTGSTHAINHFAELAVKEGWKNRAFNIKNVLVFYLDGSFNNLCISESSLDIDTIEGWFKAIELMREVEPEQLYGECINSDGFARLKVGEIYKFYSQTDIYYRIENNNISGFSKSNFKLVPESAYLEQEAKKENTLEYSEFSSNVAQISEETPRAKIKSGMSFRESLQPKNEISILQENGTYNILISKEIKDKVIIKFE